MKLKKRNAFLSAAVCAALTLGAVPLAAGAEDSDLIYGTMNIPYADFYAAELAGSANAYEVDAVSSATTSKWSKNGEGELFEGTYNEANTDGTGTILGVTYPVAITQAELDALGGNDYGFTALDAEPAAYKRVSVENGTASFSAVQDSTPETANVSASISTESPWGDYVVDVSGMPDSMGAILGAVLKTQSGKAYAMRHEQNIWRGEFAWSSGFKTSEPHGNMLDYENFVSLMGETISQIVYIMADGYLTADTSLYVPIKFDGSVSVSDAASGTGSTAVTTEGFPADYSKAFSVDGMQAQCSDSEIAYADAMPGQYTLTISDQNGVYADVSTSFVLFTDKLPAAYADGRLVKADGASDAELANYLKNIASVTVNGKSYSATGKGSTRIIGEDGTIDLNVSSRDGNVFDGSGSYTVSVTATGYTTELAFGISSEAPATTAAPSSGNTGNGTTENTTTGNSPSGNGTTSQTTGSTTPSTTTTTSASNSTASITSPATGSSGAAVPLAVLTAAAALAVVSRKK